MKMQVVWEDSAVHCARNVTVGYTMDAMHIHDVYEIYMAVSEGIRYMVNDRIYLLEPGDVLLFTDTDLHKSSVPPEAVYDRWVITFPPQFIREHGGEELLRCFEEGRSGGSHRLRLDVGQQAEFTALAQALMAQPAQTVAPQLGQWVELCRLLLFLERTARSAVRELPDARQSQHPQIRTVLAYIDDNFLQKLTLDELSARCFLNKHYLCRLFKKEIGFSIHEYITYRRLAQAVRLLRAGHSVTETAQLSGFGSDTFFITTFKKEMGTTPSRYARQQGAL